MVLELRTKKFIEELYLYELKSFIENEEKRAEEEAKKTEKDEKE